MVAIDNIRQIVAVIQHEIASRTWPSAAVSSLRQRSAARRESAGRRSRQAEVEDLVRTRIAAIDTGAADRGSRVFRAFLESVLVAEFGESLLIDPAFHRMIDEVHRQMESVPALAELVQRATESLLQRHRAQ